MSDFPTYNDLFRVARDQALIQNSNLTRAILERAGSDANALVSSGVAVGDEVIGQLIRVNAALFIDTATGDDLKRLVFDRYQMLAKAASPAVGTVEFTTTAPVVAGFDILAGTRLTTTDGKMFLVVAQTSFPTSSSGPVSVPVQSSLAGASQQASIGTITSIAATIAGAPADLRVTNSLATAGADDAEADPSIRDRAKRFYTTSQRGTLAAITAGGLAVPGVRSATAFEVINSTGGPARVVELIVADAFTDQLVDATTIPASYQAQSAGLTTAVVNGLNNVRAAGIQVIVQVAEVVLFGVTLILRFRAGADVGAAATQAKVVIVDYVNSLAPGQSFIYADAEERLKQVPGLVILGGEIVTPAGDVEVQQLQVLRTTLGFVLLGANNGN